MSKKSSLIDLSTLHAAILSITSEVRLQRETKNIMDELGIMISLLKKQKQLLERFIRLTGSLLEPESERTAATSKSTTPQTRAQERQNEERGNTDLRIFKAKAEEVSQETESHLEELKGLLESAEGVGKNVSAFSVPRDTCTSLTVSSSINSSPSSSSKRASCRHGWRFATARRP